MNPLELLWYRLTNAIAAQNKYFFDSFLARVQHFEQDFLTALLETLRDIFPLVIFAFGIVFLVARPFSNSTPTPNEPARVPKQPRVVLRPGSKASVEHNRSIALAAEEQSKLKKLDQTEKKSIAESTSMMSAPSTTLSPPLSTPISTSSLATHTGEDPSKPIYVAIKGTVFDVSAKREMYGPGGSYSIFAGRDGSKGLGMSSLKAEDAVADYSGLDEKQMKTLVQWEDFFTKRYNIVGKVVD